MSTILPNSPAPSSPTSKSPPSTSYFSPDNLDPSSLFWLLDWDGDGTISDDDVAMALVNIAVYPTIPDFSELVDALGDGSLEAFRAMIERDPAPRVMQDSPAIWEDLTKIKSNLVSLNRDDVTVSRNVFYLSLAYFGFPLNVFFGQRWALKAGVRSFLSVHVSTSLTPTTTDHRRILEAIDSDGDGH